MANQSIALETRKLSKTLSGRMVLREIDLMIAAGECLALTGINGSGKTTLLRCLAAITRPTSGVVIWFGQPAKTDFNQRRAIGLATHESQLYEDLTVRENLMFAARMCSVAQPAQRTKTLLKQTGLQAVANRQVQQMSMGMRQRLAISRAVIHDPSILLLDEPFSNLDAAGQDWLEKLLETQRANGRTVCFTAHDNDQTRRLADRTLFLHQGSLTSRPVNEDAIKNNQRLRYVA